MPVIVVHGPSLPSGEEPITLLEQMNRAAAGALGLRPDDVHSMYSPALVGVTGGAQDGPWPTALLHGRPRQSELMAAAVSGVSLVLSEAFRTEQVWVQWVLTG